MAVDDDDLEARWIAEHAAHAAVENALQLLVLSARVSPVLRAAVAEVEDELRRLRAGLTEAEQELAGVERLATAMASAIGWETEGEHWIEKATNAAERWRNFEQAERHQAELQAN